MPETDSENTARNHPLYQGESDNIPTVLPLDNKTYGNNSNESSGDEEKTKDNKNCCGRFLSNFRLEIMSCIFMFSKVLVEVSSASMILDKVCLVHYNYSREICSNLENYTEIKSDLTKTATNYEIGRTLIQTAPAVLLACFIGPWSDRYGRKVPVLIAIFGMAMDNLGSTVCAYYLYSRVEFYYIPAIFTGCFGGVVTFLTVVYSYASDVAPEEGRTMKFAFLEMAVGLSQPLGSAAGGWIYKLWGYYSVFMASAAGFTVCFILVASFLTETRGQEIEDSLKTKLKNLFTFETLKEGFVATVKQRPNEGRKQVLLLIASICCIAIATNSTGNVGYYFVHQQYNWDNTYYSTVLAIYTAISIAVLVLVVPLLKCIRAGDPMLGLIGTTSYLLKYIGIGVSWKSGVYHLACVLGCLGGISPLAGRSRISKVVSKDDMGKVFSFVATAEALLPVLTTVLISQVFIAFLKIYPGMPYMMLGIILILPFGVFVWMARLPK